MSPGIGSRARIHLIQKKPKVPRARVFRQYQPAIRSTNGLHIRLWSQFSHISRKNTKSVCVSKRRLKTNLLLNLHIHTYIAYTHIDIAVRIFEYIIHIFCTIFDTYPFSPRGKRNYRFRMHKSNRAAENNPATNPPHKHSDMSLTLTSQGHLI